jgi:hypothetical protein
MIVYEYNYKNKFPHMVLVERPKYSYHWTKIQTAEVRQLNVDKQVWLLENCGQHNVDWTKTCASIYNGKKLYWEYGNYLKYEEKQKIQAATQYGFKSKDHAMHFMLRFSNSGVS